MVQFIKPLSKIEVTKRCVKGRKGRRGGGWGIQVLHSKTSLTWKILVIMVVCSVFFHGKIWKGDIEEDSFTRDQERNQVTGTKCSDPLPAQRKKKKKNRCDIKRSHIVHFSSSLPSNITRTKTCFTIKCFK